MVLSGLTNRFACMETGGPRSRKPKRTCADCPTTIRLNAKRCGPCSYEKTMQRQRDKYRARHDAPPPTPRPVKPPKPVVVQKESIRDLGMACRAAGITLKDLAEFVKQRQTAQEPT